MSRRWSLALLMMLTPGAMCLAATNIYLGGDADGYNHRWRNGLGISSLQIDNANGATGVTELAAWLNGTVLATTAVTTVHVYWGTNNGTTARAGWEHWTNFGVRAAGDSLTTNVTGLSPDTVYYYRFHCTNANQDAWAWPATSFETLPPAVVDNANGATNVMSTSAFLNGTLTSTGELPTTVYVYWGTTDGTSNRTAWAHTNDLDVQPEGPLTTNIIELSSNTLYYYRFYATNANGEAWADPSLSFNTHGVPAADTTGAGERANSARLYGMLADGGVADVWIYWGQDTNNWANTNELGALDLGAFSTNAAGLSPATLYYYVCYASNSYGEDWSAIAEFTTVNMAIFGGGPSDGYDRTWTDAIIPTGDGGTLILIK